MRILPPYLDGDLRFFEYRLSREIPVEHREGFRIGKAGVLDILTGELRLGPRIPLRRCMQRGDECFTARRGLKTVAIGRICYADTKEVVLQKNEASLISFHTIPEFRGKALYVSLMKVMLHYLKRRGYSNCYVWAKKTNIASLRGIEKAGFTEMRVGERAASAS